MNDETGTQPEQPFISPETKNHLLNVLLLILLQTTDSVISKLIISRGGHEINPFVDSHLKAAFESIGTNPDALLGKLPYVAGILGISIAARALLSKREGMWTLRGVNIATAIVVLNNAIGIFQQSYPR